jgi:hypothetical protein
MFIWLAGNVAAAAWSEGAGWDEAEAQLHEALDAAVLPADRVRMLTFLSLIGETRGREPHLDEMRALIGADAGIEMKFGLLMVDSHGLMMRGEYAAAYDKAEEAGLLQMPNPEIFAKGMLHAAILARDPERIRIAAGLVEGLPLPGPWTRNDRAFAGAAVAAIEGRTSEAAAAFVNAYATYLDLGFRYEAAVSLVEALALLPAAPELRRIVPEVRELFESLAARPYVELLDRLVADQDDVTAAREARLAADRPVAG